MTPDPCRIASGVAWGVLLLALGLWLQPHVEHAVWYARLMAADPPERLPVPVAGVAPGDLDDTWGEARGGGRVHAGIDIFAARRRPVRSTTEGLVVRRGENPLGGRTVTILGPGGWRHYYAHLQQYGGQSEGDRVRQGEVIGFVGTSGNAPPDAPHLHYGIYAAGGPINPYPLLTAPGSDQPERSRRMPGNPARDRMVEGYGYESNRGRRGSLSALIILSGGTACLVQR